MKNKPGPAQVGAQSKAQKEQKDFQVSSNFFYSTRQSNFFLKNTSETITYSKNWTKWRAGARRGWRAKVSQCRKPERGGPFGIFRHPFCRKASKNAGGPFGEFFFRKKVSQCQKNESGDPLVSPGIVC